MNRSTQSSPSGSGSAPASSMSDWLEGMARMGYVAKGVVYLLTGVFTAYAAFTGRADTADQKEAILAIVEAPFGRLLLGVLAVGLACYAVWRGIEAWKDPESHKNKAVGLLNRIYYAVSTVLHISLAMFAARWGLGMGSTGEGSAEGHAATLLRQPFGRTMVGAVGLIIVGSAFYQFYRAYDRDFEKSMSLGELGAGGRDWVIRLGRFGLISRGVVFLLMGSFFLLAAREASAEEAGGWKQAFETIGGYAPWLLGVVALGVAAYGLLQLLKARYRHIPTT